MKILLTALSLFIAQAQAIEVSEPDLQIAQEIKISSPDDFVMTLGKVDFFIDLAAEHDTLFELKIRRAQLKLEDGSPSSVFGYSQAGGVIVVAKDPVTHISVTGVNDGHVSVLFYNASHEILAPPKHTIKLFDLNFKPLTFEYIPAQPPSKDIKMDVSILLDRSGSMGGSMQLVQTATQEFMKQLPFFTQCSVLLFGTTVIPLTQTPLPCSTSGSLLSAPIAAEGLTALFAALETGLGLHAAATGLPHLVILVTDGLNTESHALSKEQIITLKKSTNARVMAFWAGAYDHEHLKGIVDFESVSTSNIKNDLDAFFSSIGVSVSGIQTLTLL